MTWIVDNYLELIGTVSGLIYLYLEIKQKVWLWPLGLVTSAVYAVVFFETKFYADMSLQFYYIGISIYGWYWWLHGGESKGDQELPVSRINMKLAVILLGITLLLFYLMAMVLRDYTDSPVPYGDAFTTALSITATWMLARKIIEHWWIWVIVNTVSLGLYIYKGLYPTSVLFFFYATMSVVGYYQWKKTLKVTHEQQDYQTI
jgi:nicotinamide mononucleotide transporter